MAKTEKNMRYEIPLRPTEECLKDFASLYAKYDPAKIIQESRRCMSCGVPFCNWRCPLGNLMPDINSLLCAGQLELAYRELCANNPLPEITCRVCPALCEEACLSGINMMPVPVIDIERMLCDSATEHGWAAPSPPLKRRQQKIAVIGSGPAGLAAARMLNSQGFMVDVFEKDKKCGGLLRYGIPEYKLEKNILDKCLEKLALEGISFFPSHNIDQGYEFANMINEYAALIFATGCQEARDLKIPGREATNVIFAMDYLASAKDDSWESPLPPEKLNARQKRVVIIGAGDTGRDCAGTALRQGASAVTLVDILGEPELTYRPHPGEDLSLSCNFRWLHRGNSFSVREGVATHLETAKVRWCRDKKEKPCPVDIPDTMALIPGDLFIIALGFLPYLLPDYLQGEKIFVAGDARQGQSLVVTAMADGRAVANEVINYLS